MAFKLPAPVVKSFQDVQYNFEKLLARFPITSADLGAGAVKTPSTGLRTLGWGQGTLTWPGGSVTSNTITITHSLGGTPLALDCNLFGGANHVTFRVSPSPTNTTFDVSARTTDGVSPPNTQADPFYWIGVA